jgi:hypothetical protein
MLILTMVLPYSSIAASLVDGPFRLFLNEASLNKNVNPQEWDYYDGEHGKKMSSYSHGVRLFLSSIRRCRNAYLVLVATTDTSGPQGYRYYTCL